MASAMLAQLIREAGLAARGAKQAKLLRGGRSLDDFGEVVREAVIQVQRITQRSGSVTIDPVIARHLPKAALKHHYSVSQARDLAAAVSSVIHLCLWDAHDDALAKRAQRAPPGWRKEVRDLKGIYQSALERLHEAAINGDAGGAARQMARLVDTAMGRLKLALGQAARSSKFARGKVHSAGVHYVLELSFLGRRYAMLAGAAALLCQRLMSSRSRNATAKLAQRRTKPYRPYFDLWQVTLDLDQAELGSTVRYVGRLDSVDWIERPRKSESRAAIANRGAYLVVPFKSLRRQGAAPNCHFWCQGKLKEDKDGVRYVEVEQEGSGQHAGEFWEDWLADQMRAIYNLHPGSLFMEWEYPERGHFGSTLDYLSRIAGGK